MKVCSACRRCYEDDVLSCSEENHDILSDARAGSTEIIPNYRLDVLHESAATSETYRAVNTILNKPYLIKIVAPAAFDEPGKKQFLAEAQALTTIIHPNVARVFESGTLLDGSLYAVTEYFTAQTLRECFENVGKPSEVTALTILRQAAEGLEALHASGVVHRNIKPENIILTSDAENKFLVKLQNMDFGALRQHQVNANGDLFLNDLRYFSPEQCAAEDADAQTDVYALGVVLYEALAGKAPFDAVYADALVIKHLRENPPEIKINSFDLRMLLTHTLTDALQKTTRARLKTASAMARRLRHIEQLATHSSTPPPAMAYPAAMKKTAVAFSPPAKIEKIAEIEKPNAKVAAIETAAIVENVPAMESSAIVDDAALSETASVLDEPASFEPAPIVEDLPVNRAAINIEEVAPTAPAIVVEDLPAVEFQTVAETQPAIEIPSMETQPAIEAPSFVEEIAVAETPLFVEEIPPVENNAFVEEISVTETQAIFEEPTVFETQASFEPLPSFENAAVAEDFVESEKVVEDLALAENEAAAEDLFLAERETAVENAFAAESEAIIENAAEIRNAAPQASAEELPVEAFHDYSTTKLPPIEKILGDPAFKVTEIETIFSLKRGNFDIHQTSEPALVEWEQPDDVPSNTAALNLPKKDLADARFVLNADVIDEKIADEAETDDVEYVSEAHKTRRDYAAVSSVFASYEDSNKSWNLPGKRAVITGAAICGLVILAVGGVFLNRQIQSADTQTTAAKSSPTAKTLPKPAEPQRNAETIAPAKPENVTVSSVENSDAPEMPNYEPRETTDAKPVAPVSQNAGKKRPVVKTTETSKNAPQSKTETAEVFDKKGNVKPAPDKKSSKNQASTTKPDVFTRPRVVKNPKF